MSDLVSAPPSSTSLVFGNVASLAPQLLTESSETADDVENNLTSLDGLVSSTPSVNALLTGTIADLVPAPITSRENSVKPCSTELENSDGENKLTNQLSSVAQDESTSETAGAISTASAEPVSTRLRTSGAQRDRVSQKGNVDSTKEINVSDNNSHQVGTSRFKENQRRNTLKGHSSSGSSVIPRTGATSFASSQESTSLRSDTDPSSPFSSSLQNAQTVASSRKPVSKDPLADKQALSSPRHLVSQMFELSPSG
jgi:hypothetical protein